MFFYPKSSKSDVYLFTRIAHVTSDEPYFKCSVARGGYYTGQLCSFKSYPSDQ